MIKSAYEITPEEVFRLVCAYTAIKEPRIRQEFLSGIEAWSKDQFHAAEDVGKV